MLQGFIRLAVYIPVSEKNFSLISTVESDNSIQAILRILREFDSAGEIGTYKAVAEISKGAETYVPTDASTPTHGVPYVQSMVPSVRLVTYLPNSTDDEELRRLIDEIASAHPWEHPVMEVDRVSLWMPA